MSKELDRYHKPPVHIPAIQLTPPEIWSEILRHAVGSNIDERQFTSSEGLKRDGLNGLEKDESQALWVSLVTRRSLRLVSKAWYEMSSPFLYEHILGHEGNIFCLRDAMVASQRLLDASGEGHPIGWWTKRLDVIMTRMVDKSSNFDPYRIFDALADVMACLPKLRILTFFVMARGSAYDEVTALPPNVLSSLSCGESLRAFHCHCSSLRPQTDDWTTFLENHPSLESVRSSHWFEVTENAKIKLNSLKIVYPGIYKPRHDEATVYDLMNFELPAVRFAIYDSLNRTFFAQLGQQLTVIQIDIDDVDDFAGTVEPLFVEIRDKCPNLLQINLVVGELPTPKVHFPTAVKTLGLQIKGGMRRELVRHFLTELSDIISQNPTLKVVQLLNNNTVRDLKSTPYALMLAMQKTESLGMIIVDKEGCPVPAPNSQEIDSDLLDEFRDP